MGQQFNPRRKSVKKNFALNVTGYLALSVREDDYEYSVLQRTTC
jgi:hypothetical protein